ncbi:hypothetical protein B7494_g5886 [Chlorociboria aeruginascens]|nr:hypothetical protein B7494_g5886 [Chlorociboria aeruginascens]
MGASLESSRPIMAPSLASRRASRLSTYSAMAPSVTNTVKTSFTSDSAQQEIADIEYGLKKLDDKKLGSQRFIVTQEKVDEMNKLSLGAKLDRALERRMWGQDAIMKPKPKGGEKLVLDDEAREEGEIRMGDAEKVTVT